MEYRPETIDITELISRVHTNFNELFAEEAAREYPNIVKMATINKCTEVFIKTVSDMHREEINRITNKG